MKESRTIQNRDSSEHLEHYGTPRHSGRYPWGSGDNPHQRTGDFLSRFDELKKQGLPEKEIARGMGVLDQYGNPNTTKLRILKTQAVNERKSLNYEQAKSLRNKGYSYSSIAEQMGYANDSSVRSILNENAEARRQKAKETANFLKDQIKEKQIIDVGAGVEKQLGISREKLNEAIYMLESEGYKSYGRGVAQVTNKGKQTNFKVLCEPNTEYKDVYDTSKIKSIVEYRAKENTDGSDLFTKFVYPKSMDSKRIAIRYAEEGGAQQDGMIEIRRGVPDLDMGGSHYAQVRILVDGKSYAKGMAVYSDNIPAGKDMVFNTNKPSGTPVEKVLKDIKNDPDNPFGSLIKPVGGQSYYTDKNGKQQLSLINKRAEEGDWGEWSDNLPSQFLAKQSMPLIKQQLSLAIADKQAEFETIKSLTNPTVKKQLLQSFSDDCDSSAVKLKAAALPQQRHQVILPVKEMKDTEIYAPNYANGEKVALVRYPHGGTFEIPILKVNNKQADARKLLGTSPIDAVGINSKVAERLSGADFDGDTVMVIPIRGKTKITSTDPLKGLVGFDPKMEYACKDYTDPKTGKVSENLQVGVSGAVVKRLRNTNNEMGRISNLITDMTIKGASTDELARAVRHSMVVIDAEKHRLDYKQSERDNQITSLKKKYQTPSPVGDDHEITGGAATILSRSKGQASVLKRFGTPKIDETTGELIWKDKNYIDPKTGQPVKKYVNETEYVSRKVYKDGTVKETTKDRMQISTKMYETKDARNLLSGVNNEGTPQERAYAEYANTLKAMGNQARLEMIKTKDLDYSPSAKQVYKSEVDSLTRKLDISKANAPKERMAQAMANTEVAAKKKSNPDMKPGEVTKVGTQALMRAREMVGASRTTISLTNKEWEAIQAGAVSKTKLSEIISNVDVETLKEMAMPRERATVTPAKANKIAAMEASGYTQKEIAEAVGLSVSTVAKQLKEGK